MSKFTEFFGFSQKPQPQLVLPKNNTSKVMSFSNELQGFKQAKYDYSKPFVDEFSNNRWIPFGVDNLYPYVLLDMYNSSPFHAAIIDFKTKVLMGGGITITGPSETLEDKLAIEKLKQKLDDDYIERFIKEYLIHSRISYFVTRKGDKCTTQLIGSEKVRNANDNYNEDGYFFSKDWRRRRGAGKEEFYPQYDPYNKKEVTQIKVFETLDPGQDVYSVPRYSSAANWIWLDGQIAFFQKQNIENSINPSAIIKLFKTFANPEEEEAFIHGLTDSFAGARSAGKVMVFVSDDPNTAPQIDIAEPNKLDRAFAGVQTNIANNVAYSHLINPSLMGISTAGKLGQTQELIDAYNIFNEVYIKPTQKKLSGYLTQLAKIENKKLTVTLNNNNKFLNKQ